MGNENSAELCSQRHPKGSGHIFAVIIRRPQSSYFLSPQMTKLKGAGLNDSKGEFTLIKDTYAVVEDLKEAVEHLSPETSRPLFVWTPALPKNCQGELAQVVLRLPYRATFNL